MSESSLIGRKNAYICKDCGGATVTVDRDDGVTPFMLRCRAKEGCGGWAESSFYRCDQSLEATHEWYKPSGAQIAVSNAGARAHYRQGGLALRPIKSP